MRRHLYVLATVLVAFGSCATAEASWIFSSSHYSHDPATGQRTSQYAQPAAPYVRVDPTYLQSAYRHNRSSLRVGGSADHLHVVETWGMGEFIRPYGEWLRPFREGATPFGPWGNPQGPWTDPFGAWENPYGLGRLPYSPWTYGDYGPGMGPGRFPAGPQAHRRPSEEDDDEPGHNGDAWERRRGGRGDRGGGDQRRGE